MSEGIEMIINFAEGFLYSTILIISFATFLWVYNKLGDGK